MKTKDILSELDELTDQVNADYKQSFIKWCVSWLFVFTIIGIVCRFNPNVSWLWTLGLVTALISLLFMFLSTIVVHKQIERIKLQYKV
jgi:ABC-type multidrug transport system permease subunit